jgi:formylmethanofuran dehydrogenase subunit C
VSALTLTLKEAPQQRCDLSALSPDRLATGDGSIERIEIHTTKRRLTVGDLFKVRVGDPENICIEGGSERFDFLGAGMLRGRIEVLGDVGQQVGRGMKGGTILVGGNAGRLAGSAMRDGRLEISGDAGDLIGGPLPGDARGMTGGVIRVQGNAGERGGDRMRRGLIAIDGNAGANPASRMIGGTLVCLGCAGADPGYLMRRGTIILAGGAKRVGPTFIDTGAHELVAMRLIARWLIDEGVEGASLTASPMRRLVGDTATIGKGELFLPQNETL